MADKNKISINSSFIDEKENNPLSLNGAKLPPRVQSGTLRKNSIISSIISHTRDKITRLAPDVESLILTNPHPKFLRLQSGHSRLNSMGGHNSKMGLDEVMERSFIPVNSFKEKPNLTSINSHTAYSRFQQEAVESFPASKLLVGKRNRPQTAGVSRQTMAEIFSVKSKRNHDVYGAIPIQESYK